MTTYTGDYARSGKPESDTLVGKAAETAGRVAGTVGEVAKSAGDKVSSMAGKAAETTGKVVGSIEEMAPLLKDARESVAEVGGDLDYAIREAVKKQPLVSLAVVAGLAFVLGALCRR